MSFDTIIWDRINTIAEHTDESDIVSKALRYIKEDSRDVAILRAEALFNMSSECDKQRISNKKSLMRKIANKGK